MLQSQWWLILWTLHWRTSDRVALLLTFPSYNLIVSFLLDWTLSNDQLKNIYRHIYKFSCVYDKLDDTKREIHGIMWRVNRVNTTINKSFPDFDHTVFGCGDQITLRSLDHGDVADDIGVAYGRWIVRHGDAQRRRRGFQTRRQMMVVMSADVVRPQCGWPFLLDVGLHLLYHLDSIHESNAKTLRKSVKLTKLNPKMTEILLVGKIFCLYGVIGSRTH